MSRAARGKISRDAGAGSASQVLAGFAASLEFEQIPSDVIQQAKLCIIDTVAVAVYGARFPWSRIVAGYSRRYGAGGPCSLLGIPEARVQAPFAALANGALAHAFEQDSLREPGAGVHPGATLLPPALAMAEETGASGKALLTAFVAGCEVMFRIGDASRHSSEKLGFHAPGLTGPFGAAIAAGRVLGLNGAQLGHALGIAASLSSGLLAFTKARSGAAVKRLHLGRAAESGVLAARLAADGMTGPETALDGRFGYLEAYCRDAEPGRLTAGLGKHWETRRICIKRYACHVTAQTPVQALRELIVEHGFGGRDVDEIRIEGAEKLLTHHDIREPRDVMQAQYSVPFCVALALYRDPADPRSFDQEAVADPDIRAACRRVRLALFPEAERASSPWQTRVSVVLRDSRHFVRDGLAFRGMPQDPVDPLEMRNKFALLAADLGEAAAKRLLHHLENLESLPRLALSR